jgi:hypothetical protein
MHLEVLVEESSARVVSPAAERRTPGSFDAAISARRFRSRGAATCRSFGA